MKPINKLLTKNCFARNLLSVDFIRLIDGAKKTHKIKSFEKMWVIYFYHGLFVIEAIHIAILRLIRKSVCLWEREMTLRHAINQSQFEWTFYAHSDKMASFNRWRDCHFRMYHTWSHLFLLQHLSNILIT